MGCPVGTVASRLSRGRDRLRATLGRRGLALGVAALGAVLSSEATGAVVPPALLSSTTRMAVSTVDGASGGRGDPIRSHHSCSGDIESHAHDQVEIDDRGLAVSLHRSPPASGRGTASAGASTAAGSRRSGRAGRAGDRRRVRSAMQKARRSAAWGSDVGQGPTLKGKIVIFGEGKLDVPDIHQIRALDPDGGASRTIAEFSRPRLERPRLARRPSDCLLAVPTEHRGKQGHQPLGHGCRWPKSREGRRERRRRIGMSVACWSPDGKEVVFHRQEQAAPRSRITSSIWTRERSSGSDLPGNEVVTSWSPDGTEWLTATLGAPPDPDPEQFQIYRVKRDGSGRVRAG